MYTQNAFIAYIRPLATAALNDSSCNYDITVSNIYGKPQEGRNQVAPASQRIGYLISNAYNEGEIDKDTVILARTLLRDGIINRYEHAHNISNPVIEDKDVKIAELKALVTSLQQDKVSLHQANISLVNMIRLQGRKGIVTKLYSAIVQRVSI